MALIVTPLVTRFLSLVMFGAICVRANSNPKAYAMVLINLTSYVLPIFKFKTV